MKIRVMKSREIEVDGKKLSIKAGDMGDYTAAELATLEPRFQDGTLMLEAEYQAQQATVKAREQSVDNAIRASKAFAPKEDTTKIRERALKLEAAEPGAGLDYINSLPERKGAASEERITASGEGEIVELEPGLRETVKGYIRACQPFEKELPNGGILKAACRQSNSARAVEEAIGLSRRRAIIAQRLADMISAGADFSFNENLVKATAYAGDQYGDAAAALGALNSGIVLQWNLGFLGYDLAYLNDILIDASNTPLLFNQMAHTRYISIPKVQLKSSTTSWSGGNGAAVDVNIAIDAHPGVGITINEAVLGATARQLFNEQKTPQLYSLGQYITYKVVNTIINGSTRMANPAARTATTSTIKFCDGGTGQPAVFKVNNATLKTFTSDLPTHMNLYKLPGGNEPPDASADALMRFAWVHSTVYAAATGDTTFLLNQSIQSVGKTSSNGNVVETGRFRRLGNIKFSQSQLISDQCTVTGTGADGTTNGIEVSAGDYTAATTVGFAGTRNSLIFASRVPNDYMKVMPEIPSTAAVELVTEPRTGITFMVVKFLDHGAMSANMIVQVMCGVAVGDERQGILLNQK